MVCVFLNVGYYIFTDVSLNPHPKQHTQATSTIWGVIVSTGTRGRYLYSPRDGSLADASPSSWPCFESGF